MTTEEAIEHLELYVGNDCYTTKMQTVCKMAIAALRAHRKTENNAPLTLDELREMDGQPVYIHSDIFPDDCRWRVAQRIDVLRVYFTDGGSLSLTDYDKSWLAYRRKTEEGMN